MTQLADLLVLVLLLLAVARQFPQITALLGRRRDADEHSGDTLNERRTIDLVLCDQCGTASPTAARFCTRCGSRLPRFAN